MYYRVKSGEGNGRLETAVSAETPFDAAVIAFKRERPKSLGLLIEVEGDDDTHYVKSEAVIIAAGGTVETQTEAQNNSCAS